MGGVPPQKVPKNSTVWGLADGNAIRKWGSNLKNSTAENGVEFQIVPLEMGSNRKSVEKSTTPINGGRFEKTLKKVPPKRGVDLKKENRVPK